MSKSSTMRGWNLRASVGVATLLVATMSVSGSSTQPSFANASPERGPMGPTTARVSVSSSDRQANALSYGGKISADGRFVVFTSRASNLVPRDRNNNVDVFVRNLESGVTRRVSVSSRERGGNGRSWDGSVSPDGRFVVFASNASNLVPGDTNRRWDTFVRDLERGVTRRVSVNTRERQTNGPSGRGDISANGRFVVFTSAASNLVAGDTNQRDDLFVRNLKRGVTRRVSVSSSEGQANDYSKDPAISWDGRFVFFDSLASNLVAGDTNNWEDVFVRDRHSGETQMVSVNSAGVQGNDMSLTPSTSWNGRYVAFCSAASNLTANDTNDHADVFVRDLKTGQTEMVSVNSTGMPGSDGDLYCAPSISADGRYVAFISPASNLTANDTNPTNSDAFVRDRTLGSTQLTSMASNGLGADSGSWFTSVAADGRVVAFDSVAQNLVAGDTNRRSDVFVRVRW